MLCPNCNYNIPNGFKQCTNCGANVSQQFSSESFSQHNSWGNYVSSTEKPSKLKIKNVIILLIIFIGIFIGISFFYFSNVRDAVVAVRYWRLESLPNVTLETIMSSYFENIQWSKEKDGERTYVKLTGKTKGDGRDVSITFNTDDNPSISLLVDTVVVDGQSFTQEQSDNFVGTLVQAYEDGVTDFTNFGATMWGYGFDLDDIPSVLLYDVKNEDLYRAIVKRLILNKNDLTPMNPDSYNFIKKNGNMFPLLSDNYNPENIEYFVDFDDVYNQFESYDAKVIVEETYVGAGQYSVTIGDKTITYLHTFDPYGNFYEILYPGTLDNLENCSISFAGVPISKEDKDGQKSLYIAGCAIETE